MAELQESDQIRPGDFLTVYFKPWWLSADELKSEIARVFSGTIFPVVAVTVSLFGEVAFSGKARGQSGLFTTLPGRNIKVSEFRTFVDSRLGLTSGAVGDVHAERIVAGDQTASNAVPSKTWLYVGVGVLIMVAVAYLLASAGKIAALVKS